MTDQFNQVEDQYFRLKGQLQAGRITREQLESALKDMMIQDAQGRYWMLGVNDAKWYVNDGSNWTEAQPPASVAMPAASVASDAAPVVQTQPRGSNNTLLIGIAGVAILLLLGVGGLLLASSQGLFSGTVNRGGSSFPAPTSGNPSTGVQPTLSFGTSPYVVSVTYAQGASGDTKEPINPTDVFSSISTFHAIVAIRDAPPNTIFEGQWNGPSNNVESPFIDRFTIKAGGTRNLDFALAPRGSWAPGSYIFTLTVNGQTQKTAYPFTVR